MCKSFRCKDVVVTKQIYYNENFYKSATDEFNYSGDFVDYAKPKTGGNGEPETDNENRPMTNFESESLIVKKDVDNILGGQLKIDMVMEILGGSGDAENQK